MRSTTSKAETQGFVQAGTAALLTRACPRGQAVYAPIQPCSSAAPKLPGPSGRSTHVAEEAELVVLPAKAPVVRPWGAALLAPAKAARALIQHPRLPWLKLPSPSSLIVCQVGGRSLGRSSPLSQPNVRP